MSSAAVSIEGTKALVTGGAGTIGSHVVDQLVRGGAAEIVVLDNLVRGRLANLDGRAGNGSGPPGRGRHPRRGARPRADRGQGPGLPPRRDPDHAVRRGAAAGQRGAGRRHLQRDRGGGRRRRAQGRSRRRRAASTAWPRSSRRPNAPSVQQRHVLRRGEGVQRGHAAQLPRHVRPRLRRAALLQRVRPADGRPRRLHRGADPLDGAHRGRHAAADPRRRPADDGLRPRRRHRPGQHPGRDGRRDRRRLQHRQRRGDEPHGSRRRAQRGHGVRRLAPSTARPARSTA